MISTARTYAAQLAGSDQMKSAEITEYAATQEVARRRSNPQVGAARTKAETRDWSRRGS